MTDTTVQAIPHAAANGMDTQDARQFESVSVREHFPHHQRSA
ncbi:hypothetical protein [Methylotuvimicrobium alcaliphilum]|nr:hypothetical protein [Methylotuvimicrobium alcaliphilum]